MSNPTSNLYSQSFGTTPSGTIINAVISSRSPTQYDIQGNNGPYRIGQRWVNSEQNLTYTLTSYSSSNGTLSANWLSEGPGSGALNQLGTDSGTATPIAGDINILGQYLYNTTGSGNNVTISPNSGGYPLSPYVVGPVGVAGYQTIQSAINAASAAGGNATVYILPQGGPYTENLTMASTVQLVAASGPTDVRPITIIGTHTLPLTGTWGTAGLVWQGNTAIFNDVSAGTCELDFYNTIFTLTGTGYSMNIPNWTAQINFYQFFQDDGGVNGFMNNSSGGCLVIAINAAIGLSYKNQPILLNGPVSWDNMFIALPCIYTGSNSIQIQGASTFLGTQTFEDSTSAFIYNSTLSTGAIPAITYNSSGTMTISSSTIDSTNNPAITGTGAGSFQITTVAFPHNSSVANTLNVNYGTTEAGKGSFHGNVTLATAGNKLNIATGSNASIGTSSAMIAGTTTVATTAVTASSKIFLTPNTPGGTPGILSIGTITAGTSFVINSSSNTDTSTVNWWIIN